MEIDYLKKQLEHLCTDADKAESKYGLEMAVKIQMRLNEIRASSSVEMMIKIRLEDVIR